jgi:hypothetical protein
MPLWAWLLLAAGAGLLVGLESWAWMRHGTSAIGLAIGGTLSLGMVLVVVALAAAFAYGMASGVTGWDPVGLMDDATESSATGANTASRECDTNYEGECLDPDAGDYDCAGGSGDGPQYTGTVQVVGDDIHGLDRDGNGVGCE